MLPAGTTLRRATLDDLEALRGLWREFNLPEHDLEKRFTEFQLVVDPQGWILGALALRLADHHGHVHGLAIRRADLEAPLTTALWERILALAEQHGAYRLWTRERGPFWGATGFVPAPESGAGPAPATFGGGTHWQTLKLRDEPLKLIAAEEQLEAYLELERMKTDQLVRRGRFLKLMATAAAGALFLLCFAALVILFRRNRRSSAPRPAP
jgi:N-acetylglutamate synthase-like GNAT family acetyltransferase